MPAAYEHVVDAIRRAISLAEVVAGERLPGERELSESFVVSRVMVHEAIKVLRKDGILESRRGKDGGTFVCEGAAELLAIQGGREVALQRVRDVRELRLAVEPMAAALATERASYADIQGIAVGQREMESATSSEVFRRVDSGFHLAIAASTDNPALRQAVEDARALLFPVASGGRLSTIAPTTCRAHQDILAAITAQHPDLAAQRMREHVEVEMADLEGVVATFE